MFDRAVFPGGVHPLKDEQQRPFVLRVEEFRPRLQVCDAVPEALFRRILVSRQIGVAGPMTRENGAVAGSDAVTVDVHPGFGLFF